MTQIGKLEGFQCEFILDELDWAYIKYSVTLSSVQQQDLLYVEQNAVSAIKTNAETA